MLKTLTALLWLILFAAIMNSCQKSQDQPIAQEEPKPVVEEAKEIPSVCIWDAASVRASASMKSKWISAMALGEKVVWLGKEKLDSTDNNRKFLKIRLSDGTEGWSSEYVIATDAKPSAVFKEAPIYRRPDLLTITNVVFEPMEIVAVTGADGDWIEVVGEKSKKKGWIQSKLVSTEDTDVAVALLAGKALAEKSDDSKKEKLQSIIDNTAFVSSIFIEDLEMKLKEMQPEEMEVQDADSSDVVM